MDSGRRRGFYFHLMAGVGATLAPLALAGCVDLFRPSDDALTVRIQQLIEQELRGRTQPGPEGPAGATGPAGESGAQGPQGEAGPTGATGPQGAAGPQGAVGPQGEDGQLRIFGDGSAGTQIVDADTTLEEFADDANVESYQFQNLTIAEGVTLTVPSGTVLRVSGDFTNNGSIVVEPAAFGNALGNGEQGIARTLPQVAGNTSIPNAPARAIGGQGGVGVEEARFGLLNPGFLGGSGGSATDGPEGGGTLVILAKGNLVNDGEIRADGMTGTGAGGGIVVLASRTMIHNTRSAVVTARGGSGAAALVNPGSLASAGGGGGGGIVRMLAPAVDDDGDVFVDGGAGGASVDSVTNRPVGQIILGGIGGSASFGNGGLSGGATVSAATSGNINERNVALTPGDAGSSGFFEISSIDPTALF